MLLLPFAAAKDLYAAGYTGTPRDALAKFLTASGFDCVRPEDGLRAYGAALGYTGTPEDILRKIGDDLGFSGTPDDMLRNNLARTLARTYYLDSAADPGGDGRSPAAAFNTVASLVAASVFDDYVVIKVARGASFREELNLSGYDYAQAIDYGSGARPIFNASDILDPGDMTVVGDGSFSWPRTLPASANGFVNVWETTGGVTSFMTLAASQAACAATPGTYFPSAHTGTITLYIHPTSGDPSTNGSTYEVTARDHGVKTDGTGCRIRGIHGKNSYHNDGSIVALGAASTLSNFRAQNGGKHNFLISNGGAITGPSIADDAHCTGQSGIAVIFAGTGDGTPISISDLTISNAIAQPATGSRTGFESHCNSGTMGAVTLTNVAIDGTGGPSGQGIGTGFGMTGIGTLTLTGCTIRGATEGMYFYSDTVIQGASHFKTVSRSILSAANNVSFTFGDGSLNYVSSVNGFVPSFYFGNTGLDVTIEDAILAQDATDHGWLFPVYYPGSGTFTFRRNQVGGNAGFNGGRVYDLSASVTVVEADNNHYETNADRFITPSGTHLSIAAIFAADGLEENSATDGDASAAAA